MRKIIHFKLGSWIRSSLRFIVAACLIGVAIWGIMLDSNVSIYNHDPFITVDTNWVQIIDGQEYALELAQDAIVPTDGSAIILQRTIAETSQDRTLVFFVSHQTTRVYIGDELTYEATCPEELSTYASPGRYWVEMPIRSSMIGQTLRLEFSSEFPWYRGVPSTLYYIQQSEIDSAQIDYMWMHNVAALAILALAFISYMNALLWKDKKLRRYLFSLADVYVFTGLWLCGEINVLAIWLGHSTLSSLFAMLCLRIIPLVYYQLISSSMSVRPLWLKIVRVLAWSNIIISILLQLFCGVSLVRSLIGTVLVFAISCTIYIIGIIRLNWRRRNINPYDKLLYVAIVFPLAALIEAVLYVIQIYDEITGIFIAIACGIYGTIAHILLIKKEAETDVRKRELESQRYDLERKPLYQQINAHFLFNSLNVISAYCKEDPRKADKAVCLLAQYLKKYMFLVDTADYVSFREELSLMNIYLELLNLRYSDEISLETDIQFDDFLTPPLTLQPLIENSVKHGLHHFVPNGVIKITARRYNADVELIVSDNGRGFTKKSKNAGSGVGLENLTRRINAMGGELKVNSKTDRGTDIIMRIPIEPTEINKIKEREMTYESDLCGR